MRCFSSMLKTSVCCKAFTKSLEGAGVWCLGLLPDPCVKAPRAAPAFRTRAAGDEASKATSSFLRQLELYV